MKLKNFDKFLTESQDGLAIKLGDEMKSYRIPTREESLSLEIGDQVIDKSRQFLGVGTVNYFNSDKTIATVQFYDTMKGSAVGDQQSDKPEGELGSDETYQIHIKNLFAVSASED